jgi:polyferredoxin
MTGKKSLSGSFLSVRRWFQLIFLGITLAIGIQFTWFVFHLEKGIVPDVNRPPGVEAFLPISALVSLKHTLSTWTINDIHPSGLVIFLIVCATALVVKKGVCSWACPFGLMSDILAKIHTRLFHRALALPKWIDTPLRSLKYLLAGFFIYYIFYKMPLPVIEQFIHSPYNRFADIQMLAFFTDISPLALKVMLGLVLLSFVIPYFWCRYLCPYGAVLSVLGFFSIGRIQRARNTVRGRFRSGKNNRSGPRNVLPACPVWQRVRKKTPSGFRCPRSGHLSGMPCPAWSSPSCSRPALPQPGCPATGTTAFPKKPTWPM